MNIPVIGFAGLICLVGLGLPLGVRLYLPKYAISSIGFEILFLGAGLLLLVMSLRRKIWWTFAAYSTATICIYLFTLMVIVPEMNDYRSRKAFFHEAAAIMEDATLVSYNYLGLDAPFYLQRIIPIRYLPYNLHEFLNNHEEIFVVMDGGQYEHLQREHPELIEKFHVLLDRVWISAINPKKQKRLLLLKT